MRFGKFEVLARLASGGTANIFLARQVEPASLRRLVVLKTLLPNHTHDPEFRAMFVDESRLAWALSHPNCVATYEYGAIRGTQFIAMEYIMGQPLSALLIAGARSRTSVPSQVAAEVVYGASLGLHHAHELNDESGRPYNLVHRDVSPQNVMVTYEGQVKILDFGVAKAETEREPTAFGIVKGKFGYMAPEQIEGASVDRRSDVFSLGIVLFEALSGRRLFQAATVEEVAIQILSRPIPKLAELVPDVPPMLADICAKALSRKPSDRFPSARAMADALEAHLGKNSRRQGKALIADYLRKVCPSQVANTIALSESILAGTCDQHELLRALRASPVRPFDIFGLQAELDERAGDDREFSTMRVVGGGGDMQGRSFDTDDLDPTHSFDQIGDQRLLEDFDLEHTNLDGSLRATGPQPRVGGSPARGPILLRYGVEEISTAGQTAPMIEHRGDAASFAASGMMLYVGPGQRIGGNTGLDIVDEVTSGEEGEPPLVRQIPPLGGEDDTSSDEANQGDRTQAPRTQSVDASREDWFADESSATDSTAEGVAAGVDQALTAVSRNGTPIDLGSEPSTRAQRARGSPFGFILGVLLGLAFGILLERFFRF